MVYLSGNKNSVHVGITKKLVLPSSSGSRWSGKIAAAATALKKPQQVNLIDTTLHLEEGFFWPLLLVQTLEDQKTAEAAYIEKLIIGIGFAAGIPLSNTERQKFASRPAIMQAMRMVTKTTPINEIKGTNQDAVRRIAMCVTDRRLRRLVTTDKRHYVWPGYHEHIFAKEPFWKQEVLKTVMGTCLNRLEMGLTFSGKVSLADMLINVTNRESGNKPCPCALFPHKLKIQGHVRTDQLLLVAQQLKLGRTFLEAIVPYYDICT